MHPIHEHLKLILSHCTISLLKISTMSSPKFMLLLILVIFYTIAEICASISPAMPPNLPAPGPYYHPAVPAPTLTPDPYAPAPDSYPPEPESPKPYPSTPVHYSKGIKAAYWQSFNSFPASSIDTSYFTHIYYAFLLPEPDTYKLNVTSLDQEKLPEFMGTLRARHPPVKTLLSIGGGASNKTVFSKMVSDKVTRAIFINSTIEVAREYGFHGIDLDWEFPENDQDLLNLGFLYRQWRKALHHEAKISGKPRLILTSAVYYASKVATNNGEPLSYPIEAINRYVDWVSPMCFDYHGKWENFTGLHSALYDLNSNYSTSFGIGSWIQAGVPTKKLVMGLPLYGRTWKLQDPNVNGIGALALGVGPGDDGILPYNQIVEFNSNNNATIKLNSQMVSYYSYDGDSWIGYDDVRSIKFKVQFAQFQGLGGYFFWALGQDKDWTISRQASKAWGC